MSLFGPAFEIRLVLNKHSRDGEMFGGGLEEGGGHDLLSKKKIVLWISLDFKGRECGSTTYWWKTNTQHGMKRHEVFLRLISL